ncbi:ribbon-helix-helix protein [Corynebacterium variabile]|uniref:ribbon-helix-helix protein n=1 Tax=Corynebacterium variabile TaxID=1727 RepID=UPI003F91F8F7
MGIPKKNPAKGPTQGSAAQAASESLLTSRPETTDGTTEGTTDTAPRPAVRARDILPIRRVAKTKLTLTMDPALKRRLKAAAAAEDITISDLVEQWAEDWLHTQQG